MDLLEVIQKLRLEKERVERAIANFERLKQVDAPPGRRGRKSMGTEERREVSERMKRYWAAQRSNPPN
jgi:hypothetical protein